MKPLKLKPKGIKLIIAGSRSITNFDIIKETFQKTHGDRKIYEIVSGRAIGVDLLGEKLARKLGINIKKFPANWLKFGNNAGYIRNSEMAQYADELLAIWDGESKGTAHMIDLMKKNNKVVYTFEIKS